MTSITLTVSADPGSDIVRVVDDMINVATILKTGCTCKFNGYKISVWPWSKRRQVIDDYHIGVSLLCSKERYET